MGKLIPLFRNQSERLLREWATVQECAELVASVSNDPVLLAEVLRTVRQAKAAYYASRGEVVANG